MPPIPPVGQGASLPPPIPPHVLKEFEEHRRREQARIGAFGQIRPMVHLPDYAGYRFVGVRNRLYYSKKWRFFADFLFDYGTERLGKARLRELDLKRRADRTKSRRLPPH